MKTQCNISSDWGWMSLCGKPPTVSNTSLTTPHMVDLQLVKEHIWRLILIGLLSEWDDSLYVDGNLQSHYILGHTSGL